MRAAIYARYSSEMQRSASIEDQARNCRRRADAEGWIIVTTFADEGISGSDSTRPQYQQMIAAAGRHEFDVLLLDDLSRLARDSIEQEKTIRRLEFMQIRIIATSDGYDSESKARKVTRGFKGLMNEIFLDDLRAKTHRGQEGQARKGFWNGGRPYGYRLKAITDPSRLDQYNQPVKIGSKLQVNDQQAEIVREIYQRFADGQSHKAIAEHLNALGVPSPGSSWKRTTRRCSGWMGSTIRVITHSPLYGGLVRWNAMEYLTNPDTGKYSKRRRPESEWIEYRDESLRIVSDELLQRARARTKERISSDTRIRDGGKAKYVLSGLLRCACCDQHYTMAGREVYACGGYRDGKACKNDIYIKRSVLEDKVLGPIRHELLSPACIEKMVASLERKFAERMRARAAAETERPRELMDLEARIQRLRDRKKVGDPDMTSDEIQSAIDRATEKRKELESALPEAKQSAAILSAFPKAAALYRQQIEQGLDGDPRAALRARVILRKLFNGRIVLRPSPDRGLWAEFETQPAVLLKVGSCGGAEGNRTLDLCIANASLSQLSYRPHERRDSTIVVRYDRASAAMNEGAVHAGNRVAGTRIYPSGPG